MKYLYDFTLSKNYKSRCMFEDSVSEANHDFKKDDKISFEILTGGFFSKTTSFVVICKSCLYTLLVKKFKIKVDNATDTGTDYDYAFSGHSGSIFDYASFHGTNLGKSPAEPKPEHKEFIESIYNAYNDNNFDNPKMEELSSFIEQERLLQLEQEQQELEQEQQESAKKRQQEAEYQEEENKRLALLREQDNERLVLLCTRIKDLLRKKGTKMSTSDIDAHLKHQDIEEIKELCEDMYHNGEISRTGNYRYFILSEEKKKKKPAKVEKSEAVDVKSELKKYKDMLDEGLIDKEDYEAKKDELLGL